MKTIFTYSYKYSAAFVQISGAKLKKKLYPCDIVEAWEYFIETVENGYEEICPEYDHDIYVRNNVEPFLHELLLDQFPEHQEFKKKITELDTRFLEATQPDPRLMASSLPWWHRRLPLKAGKEFIDFIGKDALTKYGITIHLSE